MSSFFSRSPGAVAACAEAISVVSHPTSLPRQVARERRPAVQKKTQNGNFAASQPDCEKFPTSVRTEQRRPRPRPTAGLRSYRKPPAPGEILILDKSARPFWGGGAREALARELQASEDSWPNHELTSEGDYATTTVSATTASSSIVLSSEMVTVDRRCVPRILSVNLQNHVAAEGASRGKRLALTGLSGPHVCPTRGAVAMGSLDGTSDDHAAKPRCYWPDRRPRMA